LTEIKAPQNRRKEFKSREVVELQTSFEQQDTWQFSAPIILWQYLSGSAQYITDKQPFLYLLPSGRSNESLPHLARVWHVSLDRLMLQEWKESSLVHV